MLDALKGNNDWFNVIKILFIILLNKKNTLYYAFKWKTYEGKLTDLVDACDPPRVIDVNLAEREVTVTWYLFKESDSMLQLVQLFWLILLRSGQSYEILNDRKLRI